MLRRVACLAFTSVVAVACSSSPDADEANVEQVSTENSALTTTDAVSRAEQWVAVKLHYCQAIHGGRDYDSACSTYCNRMSNPAWDPYRSDCSGLVSWAWGLPAPGRVTGQFAPFVNDISKAIPASTLRAGDAVNNSEHVMLFKEWVTPGKRAVFIEEPGCSSSEPYARENTSDVTLSGDQIHVVSNGMTFTAIRYNALTLPATKPPASAPPKGTATSNAPTAPAAGDPDPTPASGGATGSNDPAPAEPSAPRSLAQSDTGCSATPGDVGGRSGAGLGLLLVAGTVLARRRTSRCPGR